MPTPILEIRELGGQQRVLLLSGPALPHAGTLTFRSRMKLRTEAYGTETDQQVAGEEESPSSPAGAWVDTKLAHGGPWAVFDFIELYTGVDIASAVDSLRRAGELLQVSFDSWQRYGRIEEVTFTPSTAGRLEWAIDFAWTSRTDLPAAAEHLPTPESIPNAFTSAMETALDGIDWFEQQTAFVATTTQDVLDRYVRGPLSVVTAGGQALQSASRAIETALSDSMQAATDYLRAVSSYADTVARIGGIGGVVAAECLNFETALDQLTSERFAASDDPVAQLAAGQELGAAQRMAAAIAEAAADAIRMAQYHQQTYRPDYKIHIAKSGETLLDVARRYYRDEDRWTEIALHNGLQSSALYAGQEVVIP